MKVIGITTSEQKGETRDSQCVYEEYIEAIERAGGIPILLPISEDECIIEGQIKCLDGLLVTGGIDVNPLFYHENCRYEQGESSSKRDTYEINLIKKCVEDQKPILGICRGQQIINVAFGGTLYQDNQLAGPHVFQHTQKEKREFPIHRIQIKQGSFLDSIFNNEAYVNSFHHQSIHRLAEGFIEVARSDDNLIEAIQHQTLDIYAVQFHPEAMCLRDHKMQDIFNQFVKRC